MSYAAALGALGVDANVSVSAQASAQAQAYVEQKLADDLNRRLMEGDYSLTKSDFDAYATGAAQVAGAAVCTAYGLAAAAPFCASVAGKVASFFTNTVWGTFSDWLSSDSEERELERQRLLLQQQKNRAAISVVWLQAGLAVKQAQATLLKLASDLDLTKLRWTYADAKKTLAKPTGAKGAGLLDSDDIYTQLWIDGMPQGTGKYKSTSFGGIPDWLKMYDDHYFTLDAIYAEVKTFLDKLKAAEAKTAAKLVAAAAAREAFKQKMTSEQQRREAESSKRTLFWVVGLGALWGGTWWWLSRRKRSKRRS